MDPPALMAVHALPGCPLRTNSAFLSQSVFPKPGALQAAFFAGQGQQPQFLPPGCYGRRMSVAASP
eukprot:4874218-Pyramimonas_sp.AAC.1